MLSLLLLATALPSCLSVPRIKTEGSAFPLLARAEGTGARSRSCHNGTEFIVTFAEENHHDEAVRIMSDRLGSGPLNSCRSLKHSNGTSTVGQINAMTVCFPSGDDLSSHLQVLMAMDGVQAIEENLPVNLLYTPWHLDRIDQISLPLDGAYLPQGTGQGVRVYITDTGTDAWHPDFEGRVAAGFSAVAGQQATVDYGNHGTHTAGIVGSRSYGVAKQAQIIPVKVFSDFGGGASSADIVEGINWVIWQKAAYRESAVLSMSLGMPGSQFYAGEQALMSAAQAGIITVVAAGNDAADACNYWPAQSNYVITVGSTDQYDYRSSFSNYGSCVDVYAPGSDVQSTLPGGRTGLMSGTSMACPVVSGTVAIYLERHPYARLQEMKNAILRNAVGDKNVVAANRMLLVQAIERTAWAMVESSALPVPASELQAVGSAGRLALPLGIGCVATLVAFLVANERTKRRPAFPMPAML